MQKLISVCIPTYEMRGLGDKYLKESFDILANQTFKNFDVVISDNSKTDIIKDVCEQYKDRLDITYLKNPGLVGTMPSNTNNAIRHAKGKLIKILLQDDFLYTERSLEEIAENFDLETDGWLVTACIHFRDGGTFYRPFNPRYHEKIHLGRNTISSPSVLTIKNENPLFFDENLIWYVDVDYYKRCHDAFGEPKIVNAINVVNRLGAHQVTNTQINPALSLKEYKYMLKKFHEKNFIGLMLMATAKTYARAIKRKFKR